VSAFRPTCAVALLLALALGAGSVQAREPCPDGVFLSAAASLTTAAGAAVSAAVTVEAGRVVLAGLCDEPATASLRAKRRGDALAARWPACGGFPAAVRLKARIDAADCRTMSGVVRAAKTRPRAQRFVATRLSPRARALVAALGAPAVVARMRHENFPYLIRPAAEAYNPELQELVALGADAVPATLIALRQTAGVTDETRLALLAVALERLGDPGAVPALRDWLAANLFSASLTWAPHLATHALKRLAGQSDVRDDASYGIDEMLDAVARTRVGEPAATGAAALRQRAGSAEGANNCPQTLVVTGLDDAGAEIEVRMPYATFARDIDALIADEADPARRAALERNRALWRSRDEEVYGGTDYVPVAPDADVSLRSNCGGSVLERMLNEVARRNGLPIRLGPGAAGADQARDLARTFGGSVAIGGLEPLLCVVSHDREDGRSAHVEIPIERLDAENLLVFSKDVQGLPRQHVVDVDDVLNAFGPVRDAYNFRPFNDYTTTTSSFARIEPSRVLDIRLDSSACPCGFGGGVGLTLAEPAGDDVAAQRTAVSGSVDDPAVRLVTLRLNGRAETVPVESGRFATEVAFRTGDNQLAVVADAPDGRRGCVERTVRAPCDFTDPADPFNGGGWVRLTVDGGREIEWPGYTAISLVSKRQAVVWFGAPPTGEPHVLFELYGPPAVRPGRFEVRPRPASEDAFARSYAVGSYRDRVDGSARPVGHELVGGTLDIEELGVGRARRLRGAFDVSARHPDGGATRRLVGRFDLCRYGIERRSGLDQAD